MDAHLSQWSDDQEITGEEGFGPVSDSLNHCARESENAIVGMAAAWKPISIYSSDHDCGDDSDFFLDYAHVGS